MKRVILGFSAVVVFGGVLLGVYSFGKHQQPKAENSNAGYPLLAKRIFIDDPNDTFVNFSELRTQLNTYFKDNNLQGSLYFEYLPTGTSIRIDGDKQEVGASLLKVPAAMELYIRHLN